MSETEAEKSWLSRLSNAVARNELELYFGVVLFLMIGPIIYSGMPAELEDIF